MVLICLASMPAKIPIMGFLKKLKSPLHRFTDSPTYRFTGHRLTDSPLHPNRHNQRMQIHPAQCQNLNKHCQRGNHKTFQSAGLASQRTLHGTHPKSGRFKNVPKLHWMPNELTGA